MTDREMGRVRLETEGPIATIVFDRPKALNALTPAMIATFADVIEVVDGREDIRCLVLRGEGRAFLAGGDLDYLLEAKDEAAAAADSTIKSLNRAVARLTTLSKPTIASVHGVAAGVGFSLTLACDLAIAADGTRFVYAYDAISASPDGGLSYLLPRVAGLSVATSIAFLGVPLSAAEALANRIVTRLVPADALIAETEALAHRLAQRNIEAMVATRKLYHKSFDQDFVQQLDDERQTFVSLAGTQSFRDAIDAFYMARKTRKKT